MDKASELGVPEEAVMKDAVTHVLETVCDILSVFAWNCLVDKGIHL